MSRVLLRRMQEMQARPGICDMSLGIGTAMPFTFTLPITLDYQTALGQSTLSTSYTFSNVDIGAEAANRYVIVGVAGRSSSTVAHTIGSVVINTTTGTINVQAATTAITAGIVTGLVTGSTAVSITVNFSTVTTQRMGGCFIDVWRVTGLNSATAAATTNSFALPASATLAGTSNGFCVGIAAIGNNGGLTVTGLTEHGGHGFSGPTNTIRVKAADGMSSSGYTIAVTYSNTGTTAPSAVFAAF